MKTILAFQFIFISGVPRIIILAIAVLVQMIVTVRQCLLSNIISVLLSIDAQSTMHKESRSFFFFLISYNLFHQWSLALNNMSLTYSIFLIVHFCVSNARHVMRLYMFTYAIKTPIAVNCCMISCFILMHYVSYIHPMSSPQYGFRKQMYILKAVV